MGGDWLECEGPSVRLQLRNPVLVVVYDHSSTTQFLPAASSSKAVGSEMGGRGRARTQRRHFKENRENVWKRPKSDPSSENNNNSSSSNNENTYWQPFATQNPAFDEYYKVFLPHIRDDYFSYTKTGFNGVIIFHILKSSLWLLSLVKNFFRYLLVCSWIFSFIWYFTYSIGFWMLEYIINVLFLFLYFCGNTNL